MDAGLQRESFNFYCTACINTSYRTGKMTACKGKKGLRINSFQQVKAATFIMSARIQLGKIMQVSIYVHGCGKIACVMIIHSS